MKKKYIKITLDIIMTLLLLLMYGKNVISIRFHEVGGLVLFGLFFIHKGLNRKWIVGVGKRLTDKALPARTRLGYIVDALLLVTMSFIIVSGIMISKTIFAGTAERGMFWRPGHLFASAVAVILLGVHLGLHWSFISNMLSRPLMLKLPKAAIRPLSIMCLSALLIYGGYNITASSFARWLTIPVSAMGAGESEIRGGLPQDGHGADKGARPEGIKDNFGEAQESPGNFGGKEEPGKGNPGNSRFSFGRCIGVICSYGSITAVFAIITVSLDKLLKQRKHTAVPEY